MHASSRSTRADSAIHRAALVRGAAALLRRRDDAAGSGGLWEAYDLARDPGETSPVPPEPRLVEALMRRLALLAADASAPARVPLDAATRARLRALGYATDGDAAAPAP